MIKIREWNERYTFINSDRDFIVSFHSLNTLII